MAWSAAFSAVLYPVAPVSVPVAQAIYAPTQTPRLIPVAPVFYVPAEPLRRPAGALPVAGHLHWLTRRHLQMQGLSRIFNAAEYRAYRTDGSVPDPDVDSPHATFSALPTTPAGAWADGDWRVALTRFNGVLESLGKPFAPINEAALRLIISGGTEDDLPPAAPKSIQVEDRAGAVIRVTAVYLSNGDSAAGITLPTRWNISWTGDATGSATPALSIILGVARLSYDISLSDGQEITVSVRTEYDPGGGYVQSDAVTETITADGSGPSAVVGWGS